MRRRHFMAGLGSAAAWSRVAWSQQLTMPVVGFLATGRPGATARLQPLDDAFRAALFEEGYVQGANVEVTYRYAENEDNRLPELAAELVRRGVAVIFATGKPASVLAAKAATTTVPIVFATDADPVELGLVESLSHPGGNATGVTFLTAELTAKRLKLLHEAVPKVDLIGWLRNSSLREAQIREVEATARSLGKRLVIANASSASEIEPASAHLVQQGVGALLVGTDVLADAWADAWKDQLLGLTARRDLPAIYPLRQFAEAGGLMSYEADLSDVVHLAATYTALILKGAKPTDLPVRHSTRFELVVNRNTAKWLGIDLPASILSRADGLID